MVYSCLVPHTGVVSRKTEVYMFTQQALGEQYTWFMMGSIALWLPVCTLLATLSVVFVWWQKTAGGKIIAWVNVALAVLYVIDSLYFHYALYVIYTEKWNVVHFGSLPNPLFEPASFLFSASLLGLVHLGAPLFAMFAVKTMVKVYR